MLHSICSQHYANYTLYHACRLKVDTVYSVKGCLDRFGARGLRLKLQQKQALVRALHHISVFARDVSQMDVILIVIVG